MTKLRVGIISANWGCLAHLPAWRSLDGVEVTSICTSRPETAAAAAKQYGFDRAFHDYREMAADPDLDLIDCGTRPQLRHGMVMAALANGKHVYNGIPFAASLDDAREMWAERARTGATAAVDAPTQATPAIMLMKEMLEAGYCGELHGFHLTMEAPLFTREQANAPDYAWFADPVNAASAVRNLGSHMLHALVFLLGNVEAVVAQQLLRLKSWPQPDGSVRHPTIDVPDTGFLMLKLDSGLVGDLGVSWTMVGAPGFKLSIWGSHGRLEASSATTPQAYDTKLFGSQSSKLGQPELQEFPIPERLKVVTGSSLHADVVFPAIWSMAHIFASIRDEIAGTGQAAPNFDQALHVHEVVEAASISSRELRWVRISGL